jgi:predicted nucleotidyltransferase
VSETEHHPIASTKPPTLDRLRRQLLPFCRKHPIARLEVFGSVADGTATAASDVDLMVTFDPGVRVGKEFFAMAVGLEDILGRRVDLVKRGAIERMENPFKRRSILSCTRLVYPKQGT